MGGKKEKGGEREKGGREEGGREGRGGRAGGRGRERGREERREGGREVMRMLPNNGPAFPKQGLCALLTYLSSFRTE